MLPLLNGTLLLSVKLSFPKSFDYYWAGSVYLIMIYWFARI